MRARASGDGPFAQLAHAIDAFKESGAQSEGDTPVSGRRLEAAGGLPGEEDFAADALSVAFTLPPSYQVYQG